MARERFVEIPALHQTGMYRREALIEIGGYLTRGPWPPDIDFWFRWFEAGLPIAKLPRVLYRWRQHAGQSTRGGGQHDASRLRAAKIDALARRHAVHGSAPRAIRLVSTGNTLDTWHAELLAAGLTVTGTHAWRPGAQTPDLPADGELLLAVYGMPSVRDTLREALGHPTEPDVLLFAA